jgi:1-deoxy-D-xylulose-5-phosphate reductoisomerase
MPCMMNAANEVVVEAFLNNRIGFLEMTAIIEKTMEKVPFIQDPTIDDYQETDREARRVALEMLGSKI